MTTKLAVIVAAWCMYLSGCATAPLSKESLAARGDVEGQAVEIQLRLESLSKQNATLSMQLDEQTKARVALEARNSELVAEHNALYRAYQARMTSSKTVTSRIARRMVNGAFRNLAGLPGRSIPIAGVGVSVGLTALDVNDACATITDINVINREYGTELEDHAKICGTQIPSKEQVLTQIRSNWMDAYQSSANAINSAGQIQLGTTPPQISWDDLKENICPMLGYVRFICS